MDSTIYTIELDCEPMGPRPDSYFPGVIKDTGLEIEDFEIVSKFFGCWEWKLINVTEEKINVFIEAKPILKERIVKLEESGAIRYGSW